MSIAHFTRKIVNAASTPVGWQLVQLVELPATLPAADNTQTSAASGIGSAAALLTRSDALGATRWIIFGGSNVRVNGSAITVGARVVHDRDEIRVGDAWVCFLSTESLARVEPLPAEVAATCSRCGDPIAGGSPAVRCPRCQLWAHQAADEELTCWTDRRLCPGCDHPTELGVDLRWSPEVL